MKARGTVMSRRLASASGGFRLARASRSAIGSKSSSTHRFMAAGEVEEVSLSGNVLWLVPADRPRTQLFLKSDGVEVRRS